MTIETPAWIKDAIFYQIFPDRFHKSKHSTNQLLKLEPWDSPPTCYGFKGGDLWGIIEKLDYLQDLGVNAIYLNPVFASAANHRYHTYDYFKIDPLLGGVEALRQLLDAAHRLGVRILLDGVFNHASRGFWQFHHVLENGIDSPFVDWFHFNPDRLNRIKNWGAYPSQSEQSLLDADVGSYEAIGYHAWWNLPALPKFNTNTPAVREFLLSIAEHWIHFGIDGWRLDVPEEIDDDAFWQEFRSRVKSINPEAYIVGEIWHEARHWLKGDQFDAVMNYPLATALLGFLLRENIHPDTYKVGGYQHMLHPLDAQDFAGRIDDLLAMYDDPVNRSLFNPIDSHDTPRFLSSARGDKSALRMALLFLFTYPGVPCLYYGDEIGLDGLRDPYCRGAFPWDESGWDHELRGYAKDMIAMRKSYPALRSGTFHRLYAADDVYAFGRKLGDQVCIVILNTSEREQPITFPVYDLGVVDATLKSLIGSESAAISRSVLQEITLKPKSGIVLIHS